MSEFVIVLVLILFTAIVGVFLTEAQMTKPSLERSQTLYKQSMVAFLLGLILSVLWYLLSATPETNRIEYLAFSGGTLLEVILSLLIGLRHRRKYREYTRVTLEIEEGHYSAVSAE